MTVQSVLFQALNGLASASGLLDGSATKCAQS